MLVVESVKSEPGVRRQSTPVRKKKFPICRENMLFLRGKNVARFHQHGITKQE